MLLRTAVFSCLLLGVTLATETDTFQVLVNLFNGLFIDSALSFRYDFGSGVPLLQGKVKVTLYPPLQLLPNSKISYLSNQTNLYSMNLQALGNIIIFYDKSKRQLVLRECQINLDMIYNTMWEYTVVPNRFWLSDCSTVEFCDDGEEPEDSDQILPLLSQAMYNMVGKHMSIMYDSKEDIKTDVRRNFKIFKEMFPLLLLLKGKPIVSQFGDDSQCDEY